MVMGEKKKKKRKPSAWNIFVRDNTGKKKYTLPSGSPDLKAMSKDYHGGSSKSKSKSKPKNKPKQERTRTTTKKKDTPKKRRLGPLEKTASVYRKEMNDIARALRIPISKVKVTFNRTSVTIRIGSIIKVKRARFTDAMRDVRKKAKARI